MLVSMTAFAVTQEGYVRTISRKSVPGVPVDGVVIRIRGSHNAVQSHADGDFSLLLHNMVNGDPYTIASISKAGYEPAEQELIGRRLPCSDQVPLEILMVSRAQLAQEKEEIAAKARENIERYYQERMAALEQQLAAQTINEQEFSRRLDELEGQYERFEPLLQAMSDKLARTDYERMDSLTAQIQNAIESGNPEEAERLVRAKGDMDAREAAIRAQEEQQARAQQTLDEAQAQLNANKALTAQRKRELAEDYYRMYAAFLARFQNDSAYRYIAKRAALDTLNVYYQIHAGQFALHIINDKERARVYFMRAYRLAQDQYGELSGPMATTCNEMGLLEKMSGNPDAAMPWYERSLSIKEQTNGKHSAAVAEALNNIGELYRIRKDWRKAEDCHRRALQIRSKQFGKQSLEVAESLNNIGGTLFQQKQYIKAKELFEQVHAIFAANPKTPPVRIADNEVNLGVVAYYTERYETAQQWVTRALETYTKVLGHAHPKTRNAQACLEAVNKKLETNKHQ